MRDRTQDRLYLEALEGKYDRQFKIVFDAIRKLMVEPSHQRRPIGFTADA